MLIKLQRAIKILILGKTRYRESVLRDLKDAAQNLEDACNLIVEALNNFGRKRKVEK